MAPPGFQAPAPVATRGGFASTPEHVEVDFGAVEGKKKKKLVWILVAVGACFLTMCGGYYLGDARLQRDWMTKSKKASTTTGEVIKKLEQGTRQFEAVLDEEIEKTKHGAQVFSFYNPDLFTKLDGQAAAFDINNPQLRTLMATEIWTTHFRFVKNAAELLPRLHTFLALCAQIKIVVDTARGIENKYSEALAKKTRTAKAEAAKKPQFGVMLRSEKDALFFALGDPVDKDGKAVEKHDAAEGYMLPNARPAYFGKPQTKPNECPEVLGTIRIFGVDDAELKTRLKCQGQEDVVFEAWVAQIAQLKILFKQMEAVNPRDLYQQFQKSGGQ